MEEGRSSALTGKRVSSHPERRPPADRESQQNPDQLFVEAYCNADFASEVDDMYRSSGGWVQLPDESGQFFPLAASMAQHEANGREPQHHRS